VYAHFDAEYAPAASVAESSPADVEVRFEASASVSSGRILRGGHKSVRWHVNLAPPEREPLRASVRLRGRPRSFGISLIQGYVVEPLVSLAAARRGRVLLPAAAFSENGSALILLGRSRSGKSSLAVHALSSGRVLLGDDQVLLEEPRRCRPFPRRLRLYADVRHTAPASHTALSPRSRLSLQVLRVADALSGGYVRPPIRVQATELGRAGSSPLPIGRVVLIERGGSGRELSVNRLDAGALVDAGVALLAEQRAQLQATADESWDRAVRAAGKAEELTLRNVLGGVPAEQISVPRAWNAARAIGALAERFRLPRA
jgi:hypothetical protein